MKKAMLFVSFGTSYEDTRTKTIDAIQAKVRATFPDCTPYYAWTSSRIIEKVQSERGEHHDTIDEALARMTADGVEDLIVTTTFLMRGVEMERVRKAVLEWSDKYDVPTHIADTLLESEEDRAAVAQVICDEFDFIGKDEALLLMGHGSGYAPNDVYSQVQDELRALGRERFFVAAVEGEPTFADVVRSIEESRVRCVYLAPLMIVAGDHAKNDMVGDGKDSWASQLKARGLQVKTVMKGLGEYAGIQELVCDHVDVALMVREVNMRG